MADRANIQGTKAGRDQSHQFRNPHKHAEKKDERNCLRYFLPAAYAKINIDIVHQRAPCLLFQY